LILVIALTARFTLFHPPPTSAEGLLERADKLAWNNVWVDADPLYFQAEKEFREKGDAGNALYAHVSQYALKMENSDLSQLIAELNADLKLPEAANPKIRLRVLEMKAKCEEEYDAGISKQTFTEVQSLAFAQYKYHLASRASGEQGLLAFTLGDIGEASTKVKRAYIVAKFLRDPTAHVRYASLIGLGLAHLGRSEQAMKYLDEAIQTQEDNPSVAQPIVAYIGKIDTLSQMGKYTEALALEERVAVFPKAHHLYGQLQALLASRADVLSKMGKNDDAISGFQEALSYARKLHAPRGISDTAARLALSFERMGDLQKALIAIDEAISANQQTPHEMFMVPGNLAIKARILQKLGRTREAEDLYRRGTKILDVMLVHVPTAETERLLLTELSDLYNGYFELLADSGRIPDAFRVIEAARGRIETQQLEFDQTEIPHAATADDKQLHALEVALITTSGEPGNGAIEALRPDQDAKQTSRSNITTATLAQLQASLKPTELLIEYVLSTPHSYALAVTSTSVKRHILPNKGLIEGEAANYRDILHKKQTDTKLGQSLFEHLLAFASEYSDAKSLIIVPDGNLHLLPFSALVDYDGKYLLEKEPISVAPSGTVLFLIRHRPLTTVATLPYLGVAAWTSTATSRPWTLRLRSAGSESTELSALPESRNEVESIGAMMPQPSTILLGKDATTQTFKNLPLGDYRVLHLALHGFVDPVFPDKSAIVFAPSGGNNGRLEARDIRQLHLRADLVTLSACDTGVGPVGTSGVESVVASFIQAGATTVVSTLWELEDHSSNQFMKAFYTHLATADKAGALRQAELDLMHSGLPPYYWASYEIVGDSQGSVFPPK
jgi:CHAT domain-containing protein/tetratricopeptide (TPR) repeat protein